MRWFLGSHARASTDAMVVVMSMLIAFWLGNADANVAARGNVNTAVVHRIAFLSRGGGGGAGSDDPYAYDANDPMAGTGAGMEHMPQTLDQQPFQDRIDAWKRYQQEQYSTSTSAEANNLPEYSPRDAEGRMKLLTSVSKGSRALIFFLLLWRDVHLYEVADTSLSGISRLLVVTPLCALFLANLAGVVASLTSPGHSAKKRLKAILNLDKLVEAILICYNFIRLTVWPAKYVPREVFIANTLHSVFFLLQSQAFTRVTWDQITEQTAFTDRPSWESDEPLYEQAPVLRGGDDNLPNYGSR